MRFHHEMRDAATADMSVDKGFLLPFILSGISVPCTHKSKYESHMYLCREAVAFPFNSST